MMNLQGILLKSVKVTSNDSYEKKVLINNVIKDKWNKRRSTKG